MDKKIISLMSVVVIVLASLLNVIGIADGDLIDEGSLVARDKIFIWENSDFTAENGVVNGSGTPGDPYIIENWTINHGMAGQIIIDGTDSHVIVRNCKVWGNPNSGPGINIINASNVSIINCTLEDLDLGIWIQVGSNNVTVGNTYFNNTEDGLRVDNSGEINVQSNFFLLNDNSIDFEEKVTSSEISNNLIIGCDESIIIQEGSENNRIHNNSIFKETVEYPYPEDRDYFHGRGVEVIDSDNNTFEFNKIIGSNGRILIQGSSETRIIQNEISNEPFNKSGFEEIGIGLWSSPNSCVLNNRMNNTGIMVMGDSPADMTSITIDESNTVDGKPIKYIKDKRTKPDLNGDWGQIIFSNCSGFNVNSLSMDSIGILMFFIFCEDMIVEDNTLENSVAGIYILLSDIMTVRNNEIDGNFYGILDHLSTNSTISSNKIDDCGMGIMVDSLGIRIDNNTISRTRTGMMLSGDNITIIDNSIDNGFSGMWLYGDNNTIVDNSIDNGSYGMEIRGSNNSVMRNTIRSQEDYGILLESRFHPDFDEDEYTGSIYNDVEENEIINCTIGLRIDTGNNTVVGNMVKYCYDGINIRSDWNDLTGNHILKNSNRGIISEGNHNAFISNEIWGNYIGIRLHEESSLNEIRENEITRNDLGIHLIEEVSGTKILKNNISLNFRFAIVIDDDNASSNEIYWNRFYGNNNGGIQALNNASGNEWDDGIGRGNYWDDYTTLYVPPAVNDGTIWNISYALAGSASSADRYPLVYPSGETYRALKIIAPEIPEARVANQFSVRFDYKSVGLSDDSIRYVLKTNSSWLTLHQNGVLNGTPGKGDVGLYWVNVSVTGGDLGDWVNFTLKVIDPYISPWIKTNNIVTVLQGSSYYNDYEAGGNGSFSWMLATSAGFLSMNSTTGELTGKPGNDHVGTHWVNVSLLDGDSIVDYSNFTLTVENVNDPPTGGVINFGDIEFKEGSYQNLSITVTDPDKEHGDRFNITWTIAGIGIVGYGEFVNLSLPAGNYSLSVKITDGNGSFIYVNQTITVKSETHPQEDDDLWKYIVIAMIPLVILLVGVILIVIKRRRTEEVIESAPPGDIGYRSPVKGPGKIGELIEDELVATGDLSEPPSIDDFDSGDSDPVIIESGLLGSKLLMEGLMDEALTSEDSSLPYDDHLEDGLQIKYSEGDITREEFDHIISILRGEE